MRKFGKFFHLGLFDCFVFLGHVFDQKFILSNLGSVKVYVVFKGPIFSLYDFSNVLYLIDFLNQGLFFFVDNKILSFVLVVSFLKIFKYFLNFLIEILDEILLYIFKSIKNSLRNLINSGFDLVLKTFGSFLSTQKFEFS